MATINDVARRAGVSRSTVSLVINHSPLVKEKTRKLVEKAIAELQYVPNSNARGLSARVCNNLGLVFMQDYLPNSTQVSYDNDQHVGLCSFNIFNGVMAGLAGTNYGVITERFCSIAEPEALPRVVLEKRVDGLLVMGRPYSDRFIRNLRDTGLPFVLVGVGSREEGIDSIYADPGEGTAMAVEELLQTGHRDICLINCSPLLSSHQWRRDAYRATLEKAGLPYRETWNIESGANNGACARKAFAAFWEAGNRPDAIVSANGQSAMGAMSYLYEKGVRIPEDLSIIAYEDSALCGYATPALTSVNVRKEEMGRQAAQCLLRHIRNPGEKPEIRAIEPFLVRRNSVKSRETQGGSSI